MYSVSDFGRMIDDDVRTRAYARALESTVTEGSVVLDIGTGTGIFAMLACRYGARQVYAVDPNDAIEVAREIARDNGYADRIEFIQALSDKVELPERVDVIVSDVRGILPYCGPSISAIADARERFLKDGGTIIPQFDQVWIVPVESEEIYRRYRHPWVENRFGFDLRAGKRSAVNAWRHAQANPSGFLADPILLTTIDYRKVNDPNMRVSIEMRATRVGTLHGFNIWFDTTLWPGIGFSTSPAEEKRIYQSAFFPLEDQTPVGRDDLVELDIRADLVDGEYIWTWKTRVAGKVFNQSTFQSKPLPLEITKQ